MVESLTTLMKLVAHRARYMEFIVMATSTALSTNTVNRGVSPPRVTDALPEVQSGFTEEVHVAEVFRELHVERFLSLRPQRLRSGFGRHLFDTGEIAQFRKLGDLKHFKLYSGIHANIFTR